jgi:DNA polymerase-3 subunit alpha
MNRLRELLAQHPGTTDVRVKLINGSRITMMAMPPQLRVSTGNDLFGDLKAILGPQCL